MHSKSKPGFIRLNTLALAAALALACTLALLFCGCQSKAEREKLAEEGLLYYKNLDFNNAKRCFLTCGDSYKYTEYLESIAEYEKLYAQAVELVSAGKPNGRVRYLSELPDISTVLTLLNILIRSKFIMTAA